MKFHLKITLLILPVIFYLANPSNVQSFSPTGTLTLGLDYHNGQLLEIENEDEASRVVSTRPFRTPLPKPYTFYSAELYDSNNNLLTVTLVDQWNTFGVSSASQAFNGTSGRVMITIPFDPSLAKIVFKNEKGQPAGEARVDSIFFCNFNNVCEAQLGENTNNCPVDCYAPPTYVPVDNVSPSPSVAPTSTRSVWKIFLPALIWFGLAIGIGGLWFVIKAKRNANL